VKLFQKTGGYWEVPETAGYTFADPKALQQLRRSSGSRCPPASAAEAGQFRGLARVLGAIPGILGFTTPDRLA